MKGGNAMKKAQKMLNLTNSKLTMYTAKLKSTKYFDDMWREEKKQSRDATTTWLTTGFFSMVTALNVCDQITTFGFMTPEDCKLPQNAHFKVGGIFMFFRHVPQVLKTV